MSAGESEMLDALMARLAVVEHSAAIDLRLLGDVPPDVAAFESMAEQAQSASRALLKSFEQMEDQIARIFRLLPKMLGSETSRWFARDHADFMEKLGVLDDAAAWSDIVKLRNELVHDYPIETAPRHVRLRSVVESLPLLLKIRQRLISLIDAERKERRL